MFPIRHPAAMAMVLAVNLCFFLFSTAVTANDSFDADSFLQQAIDLSKAERTGEAMALQREVLACHPDNGYVHLAASYLCWRQGNMFEAVAEGERAVELLPASYPALINLATMQENLDSCHNAINLYQRAARLSGRCEPYLGIARCYARLDDISACSNQLRHLCTRSSSFVDLVEISRTALKLGQTEIGVTAARKAIKCSTGKFDVAVAKSLLLQGLLKSNQINLAQQLVTDGFFRQCRSKEIELYVRAASALYDPMASLTAEDLLNAALRNLTETADAEVFFRLGRIFQEKANQVTDRKFEYNAWLKYARRTHARASELDPYQSRYHLALAAALLATGAQQEAQSELSIAEKLEPQSKLVSFLRSAIGPAALFAEDGAAPGDVCRVQFRVSGLSCACHVARIASTLSSLTGVVFVKLQHHEPFYGTMLIDTSQTDIDTVWSSCKTSLAGGPSMKEPFEFNFESIQSQAIVSMESVVKIAQDADFGDVLQFFQHPFILEPDRPSLESSPRKLSRRWQTRSDSTKTTI